MEKTINLQNNISRAILLYGVAMITLFAIMFFGVPSASAAITSHLDLGDRNAEVTELQAYLATDQSIYPEGLVTGYFGQLTKAAVERFQTAQGIVSQGTPATTGYGRVGPKTLAAINALLVRGDINAPLITSVNISTGNTGAAINWTASEMARGKVYYSTLPIRLSNIFDVTGVFSGEPNVSGTLATYDGVARTNHMVSISGLSPNTNYYYLVEALDSSNNVSITAPASFRTNQ
ncbi:MAG: peptidoglycan-binding protein [bacterium]|nr:peptidoglycan-binding protein [bacterium]